MQVQKGLVKYKDRSDILCTYGITDDGKTYYFLDGVVIPNGNIVATTVLVEAIDPVAMASSIGLIDPNGNVIIPFENKAIKPIANDLLLVEKAKPVTESVIEAIELRADPQAASRLVTTPAVIKENMNAKMGAEGRFVFNDQFSEATICDVNGNNLVDNELYSFVGVTADKLYLSKNTAESFVSEFSLGEKKLVLTPDMGDPMLNIGSGDASEFTVDLAAVQQNAEQAALDAEAATLAAGAAAEAAMKEDEEIRAAGAEGTAPAEGGEEVATDSTEEVGFGDTITVAASENTEGGFMPDDITAENFEQVAAVQETVVAEGAGDVVAAGTVSEETAVDEAATDAAITEGAAPVEGGDVVSTDTTEDVVSEEVAETAVVDETKVASEDVVAEDVTAEEVKDENAGVVVVSSEEVAETVEDKEFKLDFDGTSEDSAPVDLFNDDYSGDIFAGSTLQADTIVADDEEESDYADEIGMGYLPGHASKDNLIQEVTATVNDLLRVNRSQKQKILMFEERVAQLNDANGALNDRIRKQSRDFEKLKSNVENYRTVVGKLEAKNSVLEARNDSLESKTRDQERTIYRLTEENKALREQAVNNEALAQVLAEARNALVSDESYDTDDVAYYRRAA